MDRKEAAETLALMMSGYSRIRKNEMEWEAVTIAIEALQEQEQERKWIPVSERLPDGGYGVLVTVNGKHNNITFIDALEIAEYDNIEGWIIEGYPQWTDINVTAWQPLPEPYKESEEE